MASDLGSLGIDILAKVCYNKIVRGSKKLLRKEVVMTDLTITEALVKISKRLEKLSRKNERLKAENKRLRKELERLKKGK